ncbi:FAD binding domain protein [Fusarium beomiforme]|uniref:FAD binding domain protein n=1 Tax=Fusarium beomiforme TaxID=44412 RepID=A0A9P5AAC4_9HYPO|nr:FAD binding domain protein [Fusarium beomiforme]
MSTKPRAIIVGAGIGGLATAWWLDKAGWTSIIIERAPTVLKGCYMMSLSGPCLETLKQMDLMEALDTISYEFDEKVIHDARGRELRRLKYSDVHGGVESRTVIRGELASLLARSLPDSVEIRFIETLQEIVDDDDVDKVLVSLSTDEIIEADLLIGADGIRSSVRSQFWKDEAVLENLGYRFAAYGIEDRHLGRRCALFNSPGHRDVLYGLRHNRLVALHIWRDGFGEQYHQAFKFDKFDLLRKATTGGPTRVGEVIKSAERSNCPFTIDDLTTVSLPQWSKGRILLLGDAAHCLTLLSGQGAGMALVSAEMLGKELMATQDLTHALVNHEKKLRPMIERLQARSKKLAATYIPKNVFIYYLRNFLVRILPYAWVVKWYSHTAERNLLQEA